MPLSKHRLYAYAIFYNGYIFGIMATLILKILRVKLFLRNHYPRQREKK